MGFYYELLNRETSDQGIQIARYRPSPHTQGAWNEHEQHMAPATGVICAELERYQPRADMRYGRISLDIYGLIDLAEFEITTRCVRPGRTIELIESVFEAGGKTCIVARAWRMATENTKSVEGIEDFRIPDFHELDRWNGMTVWGGGYIRSVAEHIRVAEWRPGKGVVWLTNELDMIKGESTSSFVKLTGMVDTMNGVVLRQGSSFTHMFPNLDLQIHLYRMPEGVHLGLDAQQQYGADGMGLTTAVLHDEKGPFGHAEQILTIRKMPGK